MPMFVHHLTLNLSPRLLALPRPLALRCLPITRPPPHHHHYYTTKPPTSSPRPPRVRNKKLTRSGRTLNGSCQCGGVQFSLQSHTPVPYQLCACSICRKVGGSTGSINLGGLAGSLDIKEGEDLIKRYNAIKDRDTPSESRCSSERNFCSVCSTMLWLWDESWPELIHPFASAIDTDLPEPDEMVCLLGNSKPAWARWPEGKKKVFQGYPNDSLEGWHKKKGVFVK